MEIKPEDELSNIVLFPVKEDDPRNQVNFFMSHRKDHTAITPLSGLTKKSARSAVKSAVQLWSHLTGCSLWRKEKPGWQMM
ncbi:putative bacteriophage protein [Escherichia coli DEC7B]|nr:putative bacteriophage protein [Escherichia coli DEC7B]